MQVEKNDGMVANVLMTTDEARLLHDALTIAKLQVGPDLLKGDRCKNIDLEHLRGTLAGIAGD